jgi:hypothetical protein
MVDGGRGVSDFGIAFSQIRHFSVPHFLSDPYDSTVSKQDQAKNEGLKNGGFIARANKPVLYSTLFNLHLAVCQQLATGRVSTTDKGDGMMRK